LFIFAGFGGCPAWFLIGQSRFFQQPPATRIGVLDAVRVFEKFLNERRRPRRRVEPDLARWFVNRCFELLLLYISELSIPLRTMSVRDRVLKRRVGVESVEPVVDCFSMNVVPLG